MHAWSAAPTPLILDFFFLGVTVAALEEKVNFESQICRAPLELGFATLYDISSLLVSGLTEAKTCRRIFSTSAVWRWKPGRKKKLRLRSFVPLPAYWTGCCGRCLSSIMETVGVLKPRISHLVYVALLCHFIIGHFMCNFWPLILLCRNFLILSSFCLFNVFLPPIL